MQLNIKNIENFLDSSLREDCGVSGDITSECIIPNDAWVDFSIIVKEEAVISGTMIAGYFLHKYSNALHRVHFGDGEKVLPGTIIISGGGNAKEILAIERTVLNYLQHLSGVATLASHYTAKTAGTKAKICDTRKTLPGMRMLQKYAVTCGGGSNHRPNMESCILIKDNHVAICGGIVPALRAAKKNAPHYLKIEVECDSLEQVQQAVNEGADIIMADNMSPAMLREVVKIVGGRALVEASGGVNLETVQKIAETGVDIISVGRITHSAPAIDIGLDIKLI